MKRICVAVMLALCMTIGIAPRTARAQSSVTLYGILDGGLLYTSKTLNAASGGNGGKQFALVDSGLLPSQFGLSGIEDLGGGLKATFKLESGISIVNGGFGDSNGNFFGRQAWVALGSERYGELKVGLQFSPLFLAIFEADPRSLALFGGGLVPFADNIVATGAFNSNAISYTSPNIGGLRGTVMIALGGEAGDFQAGRQYSASLAYSAGPFRIDAALYDGNAGGTAQTTVPSTVPFIGRMVGISYHIGALTAKVAVVNYHVADSFNSYVYSGGLQYQVLPQLLVDGGAYWTIDHNDTTNHSILAAVGMQYFMSKATALYAQVGVVDNHGRMNTGLSVNGALFGAQGSTTGVDIGIRHTF